MSPDDERGIKLHIIRSEDLTARISEFGAELKSLRNNATGEEFMWQGDPGVWQGSAPVLFPVVGRLKGGGYTLDGQRYEMPKHGLARTREFGLWHDRPEEKTFVLRSDADTRRFYPFDFEILVSFAIDIESLGVSYVVRNTGSGAMYFTLGSHPAFSLPLDNAVLEDYSVEFETRETLDRYFLEDGLLCTSPEPRYLDNEKTIPVTRDLFDNDALIFKDIKSEKISLVHGRDGKRLTIDTGGAPHLGLWAKPGAPFLCIEPWFGHDDPADCTDDLAKKNGMMALGDGDEFRAGYKICLR